MTPPAPDQGKFDIRILLGLCLRKFDSLSELPDPGPTAKPKKILAPVFFKAQYDRFEEDVICKAGLYKDDIPPVEERFERCGKNEKIDETRGLVLHLDGTLNTAWYDLGGPTASVGDQGKVTHWGEQRPCSEEMIAGIIKKLAKVFDDLDEAWEKQKGNTAL